ncbi:hypothetical protein MRX96_055091 [Rhipicephalus microplus]
MTTHRLNTDLQAMIYIGILCFSCGTMMSLRTGAASTQQDTGSAMGQPGSPGTGTGCQISSCAGGPPAVGIQSVYGRSSESGTGSSLESLPLLPLPGLDRRCELEGLDASADRAGLVETSVSIGSFRVGGRLLSCFIDVEGVAFMFFKVVDIIRLAFGVLSLASFAVVAAEIKAVFSAMPRVMCTWSSGVWRFSDVIDALQLCRVSMLPSSEEKSLDVFVELPFGCSCCV